MRIQPIDMTYFNFLFVLLWAVRNKVNVLWCDGHIVHGMQNQSIEELIIRGYIRV